MKIWRSAGWPCQDPIELELLAARWLEWAPQAPGHEDRPRQLRLSAAGVDVLARSRQLNKRALSAHDQLAEKVAKQLQAAGRIVWRELSLRAQVQADPALQNASAAQLQQALLEPQELAGESPPAAKAKWRIARPDVFSLRNSSVQRYLHPVVHEIKVSRADLQSDLRNPAKRESYQWLCSEVYYVFPAGIAKLEEVPQAFGVWLLVGEGEQARLELARPAQHQACELPFPVWLALAKATPFRSDLDEQDAGPEQIHLQDEHAP
ncbi:hypothetical protein [Paucibacter sp. KBW04]|uniref:hypothetical protein n=1 Tax=Paucibacter sp. KBW04 TaxID=2153361 RepID=UPI001E471AF5|nr:hypothetical protein [Paucibacter sp. KBW04]